MNSKIGKKLLLVFVACITVAVVAVCILTAAMSISQSNKIISSMTNAGMNSLKGSIDDIFERIESTADYIDVSNTLMLGTVEMDELFEQRSESEGDFAAFFMADGTPYWKTDNYNLVDFSLDKTTPDYIGVIVDSNAGLTIQCRKSVTVGGVVKFFGVVGMSLEANDWLDDIKASTESEASVFCGTTRISTTFMDEDGQRATGSDMSERVANKVIESGEVYDGINKILGQRYSVIYEPLTDINGEVIGAYFSGVSMEENDILTNRMILVTIIMAVIVIIGSIFIISNLTAKMLLKPLEEAKKLTNMMNRGILSRGASGCVLSNDEMGDFIKSLNNTAETLNGYITDIKEVLSRMATGDFTAQPGIEYVGDFVELTASFGEISTQLSEIISSINRTSADVAGGSNRISEGSRVLSNGTRQQAEAVVGLSSTINAISTKIQKTAENAGKAGRISADSCDRIRAQNDEVKNMLLAMDEIKDKSDKILDIIQAIDDIAFQTNILALNAAIEASRAGDAGKGFAVVADEVRNLAEKSAESAKETNALIHSTIESVNKGSLVAKSTSVTMKDVMELSAKTNEYIAQISEASNEQAASIEQIKTGIERISSVVQHNSKTAEETADACSHLNEEANLLKTQIEKFKI